MDNQYPIAEQLVSKKGEKFIAIQYQMNILIPVGIFPPDIGGPADFVARIASWLTSQGHTVQVVCWSDTAPHDDSVYSFKVHRILRRGSRPGRFWLTTCRLVQLGSKADVIFVNGLALEAQVAAAILRKPTLHKVVGDYAWEVSRVRGWFAGTLDEFQHSVKPLRSKVLCLLRILPLLFCARVITPSFYLQKIICGWGIPSKRTAVIHNSTQVVAKGEAEPLPLPAFDGKTICTICRLVPWKGVDRLINLMSKLPDTRLVVAGEGPEHEKLLQLAQEEGAAGRVVFLGQLPKAQVRALFSKSDLFVLNSSYEGLPHVVLEAMAAGVAVIATDVGGTAEVVLHQETGLLVPFGDDRALLDALNLLLTSDDTRSRLARNARRHLESRFSESACFSSFEAALIAVREGA